MRQETDILRFIEAQDSSYASYDRALAEIKNGRKISHWIWYIFPQFRAFGHSSTALYYGIADKAEAIRYLEHPINIPNTKTSNVLSDRVLMNTIR